MRTRKINKRYANDGEKILHICHIFVIVLLFRKATVSGDGITSFHLVAQIIRFKEQIKDARRTII